MAQIICSLFENSVDAGNAISMLKSKGFTDSISVVTRDDVTGEPKTTNIHQDLKDGTAMGATVGAVAGVGAALLAGAVSFTVPGAGLVVMGPLATALSAGAAGAATGGVVGALVDKGIAEDQAKDFEEAVEQGEILVSVAAKPEQEGEVLDTLTDYGGVSSIVDETA